MVIVNSKICWIDSFQDEYTQEGQRIKLLLNDDGDQKYIVVTYLLRNRNNEYYQDDECALTLNAEELEIIYKEAKKLLNE